MQDWSQQIMIDALAGLIRTSAKMPALSLLGDLLLFLPCETSRTISVPADLGKRRRRLLVHGVEGPSCPETSVNNVGTLFDDSSHGSVLHEFMYGTVHNNWQEPNFCPQVVRGLV
jgi:hypothetical protein